MVHVTLNQQIRQKSINKNRSNWNHAVQPEVFIWFSNDWPFTADKLEFLASAHHWPLPLHL